MQLRQIISQVSTLREYANAENFEMPPIKVLRETFLGKKSRPFISKRDKKRREFIDPEVIGLRTPQQDFDDL